MQTVAEQAGCALPVYLSGSNRREAAPVMERSVFLVRRDRMDTHHVVAIVPFSSVGMVGRIPQIVAKYQESGVETDEDSGLSVGIVVADDQKENRIVVNADLWFGVAAVSANAAATTAGIIKVGTAT